MKTSFDMLDRLHPVIDTSTINAVLDGEVWRRKKPVGRQIKEIEVNTLPITDDRESDVQDGVMLVNIYAPNYNNGTPNETDLKAVLTLVVTAIENYTPSAGEFCNLKIISENIMQDMDDVKMSYVGLRVNYHVEV